MDTLTLLIALAGMFLAGVIKGATGLGYASSALPFLVITIGLEPAMALVLIPAMATNVSVAVSAGHLREIVARFAPLYTALAPGIIVGLVLLHWLSQALIVKILGAVMIGYAALALARPGFVIPQALQGPLQAPTGFLNGVVTGLTGSQVMPLFPYVMGLALDPGRTVQVINLAVMIASGLLLLGLAVSGIMDLALLGASLAATLPALAGVEVGTHLRQAIPVARFRALTLLVLMSMGAGMLLRA
jgi:hypothetical protein